MGHYKGSSYATQMFLNASTMITTTTTILTRATSHTAITKKPLPQSMQVVYIGEGISASRMEREFWGQLGVELNFQSIGDYYRCSGRTMATHYQLRAHL